MRYYSEEEVRRSLKNWFGFEGEELNDFMANGLVGVLPDDRYHAGWIDGMDKASKMVSEHFASSEVIS